VIRAHKHDDDDAGLLMLALILISCSSMRELALQGVPLTAGNFFE
jgi:hypothetical protein